MKGCSNPNYRHGKCINNKCIDCNKSIHPQATRCKKCEYKCHGLTITGNLNGMYNKHHTEKSKKKMSKILSDGRRKGKNNSMFGKVTHGKWDIYKGIKMRSSYEIIYAKYLDKNNIKWIYESKTFDLGNSTYTPDFYLPERNRYIEVKGWWRDDAKKKFRKFKRLYPKIKISVIISTKIKRMEIDLKNLKLGGK